MSNVAKRPQLTLAEMHQVRWLLGGVLTLLAVGTVAYIEVEAWWLMAVTAGASLLTTLRPEIVARIPRLVHVLAFPFIAAFFAADLWLRSELLPAMVRLDMLLLLYRALVYRQRRDDLQLIVLGLFLVVVAGVLTVSLAFAVQILVYTACALLFLMVLTLLHGREAQAGSEEPAGVIEGKLQSPAPAWAGSVAWRRLLRKLWGIADARVLVLGGGLFVGVVGASALLFLLIPRFQLDNGMFLDRFITKKARSGFSDTIRFGDVTEIQQDSSVALHIDVADPAQIPVSPYWRMMVLDDYNDGTFRMSPGLRMLRFEGHPRTGTLVYGHRRDARATERWTLYLEPGVSRFLPLLGHFRTLRFAEAQTYRNGWELGLLALAKEPVTMTAYQVEGFDVRTRLRDAPAGFYRERRLSRDPDSAERQREMLRQFVSEAAGPGQMSTGTFAERVSMWLRERHAYSLSPRIPDGPEDPLVRWLASRNAGHCELFAGSFVLLARAAGYPARVVTGFRGGTWNAYAEKSFTVRNADAHAWAEIYDAASGAWLRADPLELPHGAESTAGAGDRAARMDRSFAARIDSLRVFWYRRVVSFDQESQVQTLRAVKEALQTFADRLRSAIDGRVVKLKDWWRAPWDAARTGQAAGILLLAAMLTLALRRARRWLRRHPFWRRSDRRDDPVRREAGRWLRRLQSGRAQRSPSPELLGRLQRLRYGHRDSWPKPESVFREARRSR